MKNQITVDQLSKTYTVPQKQPLIKSMLFPKSKLITAVDSLSFSIKSGESVSLLGPNGAGKTTTLKLLSGLLYPTSGRINVLGHAPFSRHYDMLRHIALVMGNKTSLNWDLSPRQNYQLFKTIYRLADSEYNHYLSSLLDLLDLSLLMDTPVRKLSLGQRLKAELCGSILHRPQILFLDEPTLGLDVIAKRRIRQFLRRINREQGTTLILTSHDMVDIENVSDRVIVINQGKLIYDDSLSKLKSFYQDKKYFTVTFEEKIDPKKISPLADIISHHDLVFTLAVPISKQGEFLSTLTANYPVDDIDIRQVPLDEIMENLFTS